ncbi:MAG: hypothetical protein U9N11_04195 [Campylobacterota bacterium]|nr:hypothetical protein [Campylobacterota bacterium]
MKVSKLLKKVVKAEGKHSHTAHIIMKYKNSKEFNYLVDSSK